MTMIAKRRATRPKMAVRARSRKANMGCGERTPIGMMSRSVAANTLQYSLDIGAVAIGMQAHAELTTSYSADDTCLG